MSLTTYVLWINQILNKQWFSWHYMILMGCKNLDSCCKRMAIICLFRYQSQFLDKLSLIRPHCLWYANKKCLYHVCHHLVWILQEFKLIILLVSKIDLFVQNQGGPDVDCPGVTGDQCYTLDPHACKRLPYSLVTTSSVRGLDPLAP